MMRSQKSARYNSSYNMSNRSATVAPYFERPLDRWKLALLVPLFLLLLAGAVYRQRSWVSWIPQPPAGAVESPAIEPKLPQTQPLVQSEAVETTENLDTTKAVAEEVPIKGDDAPKPSTALTNSAERTYNPIQPLPLNNVKGQAPIMPVTLSKPAPGQSIALNELSMLQGTAAAGSTVIINHGQSTGRRADGQTVYQTGTIDEVQAGADGRWQLWLPTPLLPGDHQLAVTQVDAKNGMQTTFSPVKFTVVAATGADQSTLMPLINLPQTAALLSSSCAGSSYQRFSGTAMPGWVIQLLINEQPAGKARVGINREWNIALTQPLATGSYIARTVLLSPGGEVAAESSPVAFAMYPCQ